MLLLLLLLLPPLPACLPASAPVTKHQYQPSNKPIQATRQATPRHERWDGKDVRCVAFVTWREEAPRL
jgi:hypothetical protein